MCVYTYTYRNVHAHILTEAKYHLRRESTERSPVVWQNVSASHAASTAMLMLRPQLLHAASSQWPSVVRVLSDGSHLTGCVSPWPPIDLTRISQGSLAVRYFSIQFSVIFLFRDVRAMLWFESFFCLLVALSSLYDLWNLPYSKLICCTFLSILESSLGGNKLT